MRKLFNADTLSFFFYFHKNKAAMRPKKLVNIKHYKTNHNTNNKQIIYIQ